jgi:hypothetical protein
MPRQRTGLRSMLDSASQSLEMRSSSGSPSTSPLRHLSKVLLGERGRLDNVKLFTGTPLFLNSFGNESLLITQIYDF